MDIRFLTRLLWGSNTILEVTAFIQSIALCKCDRLPLQLARSPNTSYSLSKGKRCDMPKRSYFYMI